MILFSHPTGNANVRAALSGFYTAGLLKEFDTAIASFDGTLTGKLSKLKPLTELTRRRFEPALESLTRTYPWHEAARLLALRTGRRNLTKHETGFFSIDEVYRRHDLFVSKRIEKLANGLTSVYAYEDGCIASFKMAANLGLKCFYDLPIGYWRTSQRILQNEAERWPEWAGTLVGVKNSEKKLNRKDEELKAADAVFVASSFTSKTLKDFPGLNKPVQVIPYGFPAAAPEKTYDYTGSRPLKLLFVGGLSQRKGIADLFHVAQKFKGNVQLTVVGHKPSVACKPLDEALGAVNYIPSQPHHAILSLMREHDVFIFPSVFEGFGLVITEAMSQGTPVITTFNTAGADIIQNGANGWLVNAASTEELEQAIDHLLLNPGKIAECGNAARQTALQRPWTLYGMELADAVKTKISGR